MQNTFKPVFSGLSVPSVPSVLGPFVLLVLSGVDVPFNHAELATKYFIGCQFFLDALASMQDSGVGFPEIVAECLQRSIDHFTSEVHCHLARDNHFFCAG